MTMRQTPVPGARRASFWRISGRLLALLGLFVVGWGESQPSDFEGTLFKLIGVVLAVGGIAAYVRGKQLAAKGVQALFTSNPISSVLYLRSFQADKAASARPLAHLIGLASVVLGVMTEEEQLAASLQEVGPFIAIGKPGEKLPELGAARMYVSDAEWQTKVVDLVARSQLLVLRAGETEGFWWEVQHAIKSTPPERLVFLLPFTEVGYQKFRDRAQTLLGRSLPEYVAGRNIYGSKLRAVLYFDRDWTPTVAKISVPVSLSLRPLAIAFRTAFRPIIERLPAELRNPPTAPSLAARLAGTIPVALLTMAAFSFFGVVAGSAWNGASAVSHYDRGVALYGQRDFDGAIREYEEALRRDPGLIMAYNNLGMAMYMKGDLDRAIDQYGIALRLDQNVAIIHNNYGLALLKQKNVDDAVAEFRRASSLDPDLAVAHVNLCDTLASRKAELAEARTSCEAAIRLAPSEANPHYILGNLLRLEGNLDAAITHYRDALRLAPSSSVAHNNLGYTLAETGKPDEAIAEYRKAIRLNPNDANPHANLASVLAGKADWQGAAAELREALRTLPDAGFLHFNLGFALEKLGQPVEARQEYIRAFKLSPSDPKINRTYRRIAGL